MSSPGSITFVDAVAQGLRRTTDYAGRASRSEFWYWVLFVVLVRLVTSTIDGFLYPADITATVSSNDLDAAISELSTLVQHSLLSSTFVVELALVPSTLAVTVRRLRDSSWRPWLAIAAFVVNYGGLVAVYAASTVLLSVLTRTGGNVTDANAAELAGPVLTVIVVSILEIAAFGTLFIGVLRPTRHNSAT